ncbi:hypothetical protein E2L08_15915 [Palleronia sediminis]|uniref:Uncharacterized protein n=1 Tax=Palleronia sediminis TaxID=2547833 RepID=A0A4R5ZUW4_9RHOB|nr:hypothetical protein [Palleronia sediminis]TDL74831.1 hypothetical protein E2L08_15915 [Palleronia sediminis]
MPRVTYAFRRMLGIDAGGAIAQGSGGHVIGSFGGMPLELPVIADLASATVVGTFADASLLATRIEGDQGPLVLTLAFIGELPDPGEVTLGIAFARDMGRNWHGDESGLVLQIDSFDAGGDRVAVAGTVTGEVTGGPAQETRPVTFSFAAQLEQVE